MRAGRPPPPGGRLEEFERIDVWDLTQGTPTLADLQQFHSVLVWSDVQPDDQAAQPPQEANESTT